MKNILKSLALMLLPSLALAGIHIQQGDTNVSLGYVQVSSLTCSGSPCGTGSGGSGGYALQPATVTIQANVGLTASTVAITNPSLTASAETIISSGTGYGMSIQCNGLSGGSLASNTSGCENMSFPNGVLSDGIVIDYSNITDAQVGLRPFHIITGTGFNDPNSLFEKLGNNSGPNIQLRAASQASIEFIDTSLSAGLTVPSGKYKLSTCGAADCWTIAARQPDNGSFQHLLDFYREGSTASWSAPGDANIVIKSTAAFGWNNYGIDGGGTHAWLLRPNPTMSATTVTTLPAGAGTLNQAWVADGSNNLNYQTVGVLNSTQTWTGGNTFSSMTLQNVTINGTCSGSGCASGTSLLQSTNTWTGGNTFTSSSTFNKNATFGNTSVVTILNSLVTQNISGGSGFFSQPLFIGAPTASAGSGNSISLLDETQTTQIQIVDGAFSGNRESLTYGISAATGVFTTGLTVSGQNVCQANGTNCPAGVTGGASFAGQLLDCQITNPTSSTVVFASSATATNPCTVSFGSNIYQFVSSATLTLGASTGTVKIYISNTADGTGAGTLQAAWSAGSGLTGSGFNVQNNDSVFGGGIPLGQWNSTVAGTWDTTAASVADRRPFLNGTKPVQGGSGITTTETATTVSVAFNGQVVVPNTSTYGLIISTSSNLSNPLLSVSTTGVTSINGAIQVSSGSFLITVSSSNLAPWTTGFTLDTFYTMRSSGSIILAGGLYASSAAFTTSNINVQISSNGYVGSTGGSAPTFSGCGTSPTVTAGSNNARGSVVMTSGLSSSCTIIPASPAPSNYFCSISGGGAGAAVFFQQSANLTASCDNATGLVTCGVGTFMTWQCSGTN